MNKAFVREPDPPKHIRCPDCDVIGHPVGQATLAAHLAEPNRQRLAESACFCHNPRCKVAYFDGYEQKIAVDQIERSVYPKDPEAPICSCFGLSAEDVIHDAGAGNPAGVRALIAKSKSNEAQCLLRAPDGRCCVAEVQRLYMKHVQQSPA
jgi:hypothetical protein